MSTHQPFSDFEPPKVPRALCNWIIALVVVGSLLAVLALVATSDEASDERVRQAAAERTADQQAAALEAQRLELIAEMAGTARDAYRQGWQEALASVQSTDRGEAFALACARLWHGRQP